MPTVIVDCERPGRLSIFWEIGLFMMSIERVASIIAKPYIKAAILQYVR